MLCLPIQQGYKKLSGAEVILCEPNENTHIIYSLWSNTRTLPSLQLTNYNRDIRLTSLHWIQFTFTIYLWPFRDSHTSLYQLVQSPSVAWSGKDYFLTLNNHSKMASSTSAFAPDSSFLLFLAINSPFVSTCRRISTSCFFRSETVEVPIPYSSASCFWDSPSCIRRIKSAFSAMDSTVRRLFVSTVGWRRSTMSILRMCVGTGGITEKEWKKLRLLYSS